MKEKIDPKVIAFRDICTSLYLSSNLLEKNKKGTIVYEEGYGKVINMVLTVPKYSSMLDGGCTLAEVGCILKLTRERIRQYEDAITGNSTRAGKLMSLKNLGAFKSKREKIDFLSSLKEEAMKK